MSLCGKEAILNQKDIEIESHVENAKNLTKIIEDKDNQIAIIGNSLSWKITKPLRFISDLIRKVFRR